MKRSLNADEVDLLPLLFKLRSKWYYFVISLATLLGAALVYLKTTPRQYAFVATVLVGKEATGTRQTQRLLDAEVPEKRDIQTEDEVGLLTSLQLARQAVARLRAPVAYYAVPRTALNRLGNLVVEERSDNVPFTILPDSAAPQLVNVPVYVSWAGTDHYRVRARAAQADLTPLTDLTGSPPSRPVTDVAIDQTLPLGQPFRHPLLSFQLARNAAFVGPPGEQYYFTLQSYEQQARAGQARLKAKPLEKDSRIIALRTEGPVADREIRFLNALLAAYVDNDLAEKNRVGQRTLSFIDAQLTGVADSLRRTEQNVSRFKLSRNLVDPTAQTSGSLQRLEQLRTESDRLQLSKQYYESILDYLVNHRDATGAGSPPTTGIENQVVNTMLLELSQLEAQRAALGVTLRKDVPMLLTLEARAKSLRETLLGVIRNDLASASAELFDVQRRMGDLEGTLSTLPEAQRQLTDLQGKSAFNDRNYTYLLEKRTAAALALATNVADKKVVDAAAQEGNAPVSPKTKPTLLIALLLGLLLPATVILLFDRVNGTIKSRQEAESLTNIPFLGVVVHSAKSRLPMVEQSKSAIAESIRSLRVSLQYLSAGLDKRVIGVTSSTSGEGKSFVSSNLAVELALSGKRTLLVEADMRRPTQASVFGRKAAPGLSEYLAGMQSLTAVTQASGVENLDLITAGTIPPNPLELLAGPRLAALLADARQHYDYVVFDVPPCGLVSEYYVLKQHLDATLYITRHHYTTKTLLRDVGDLYDQGKLSQFYLVLNGVNYQSQYEYSYRAKAMKYYQA